MTNLNEAELESAYEMIAEAIDDAEAEKEVLFLSRLSLTLAHKLADIGQLQEAIAMAKKSMSQ